MPVTWFQSQQIAEAPVAPLSSQQTAAQWEGSVQNLVTGLGGHPITDLQQYVHRRWTTKFNIVKAGRLTFLHHILFNSP